MKQKKIIDSFAKRNSGRPKKVRCTALIPLDTAKIRKELLKVYKRRKKALEKLEAQLQQYSESDEPEFQRFMAQRFGAERSRIRELTEKIHLTQMRMEKIRCMAQEEGISRREYCFYLESKVTPETDFWAVLENEIQAFQEEQRRIDEEFEQYCRECDDDDDSVQIDGEFEEDFEDSDELGDEFDGIFGQGGKSIFDRLFEGLFPEEKPSKDDAKSLKKLYRELCFRYHPDKAGEHDAKTRRLWLSIQEAYDAGDMARLRAIHAGLEIESGKTELVCSDIDAMIGDVEWSIHMTRNQVREVKRSLCWGFSAWTKTRRSKAEQELTGMFKRDVEMTEEQLRQYEMELDRIRSFRPRQKKQQQKKPRFNPELQPDMFEFDIPF